MADFEESIFSSNHKQSWQWKHSNSWKNRKVFVFHSSVSRIQILRCKLLMSNLHRSIWKSLSQEPNRFPAHTPRKLLNKRHTSIGSSKLFFSRLNSGASCEKDKVLHHLLALKEKWVRFCSSKLISHLDPRQKSRGCHLNDFWKCLTALPDSYHIFQQ